MASALDCYTLEQRIKNLIQTSNVDLSVAFYIMKNMTNDLEKLYDAQIQKELNAKKNEEQTQFEHNQNI